MFETAFTWAFVYPLIAVGLCVELALAAIFFGLLVAGPYHCIKAWPLCRAAGERESRALRGHR